MAEPKVVTAILDDLPCEEDALDFGPYVETLADIIASPSTRTPLTIGIFGGWGSGKTSLMRLVRKRLPSGFRTAWFDAWKYEREEALWRALLLQVLSALKEAVPKNEAETLAELNDLETSLYRSVDRDKAGAVEIDWGKLGLGLAEGVVQIGLAFLPGGTVLNDLLKELRDKDKSSAAIEKIVTAIHREHSQIHIEQVKFLEQFHERFNKSVAEHILRKNRRLVVFVDDLDRCLPEKAVEVLEAIKLFVDAPGCVFVLALDQQVIARGIEIKYHELGLSPQADEEQRQGFLIDGARYLEKIIQLPFQLPPIERGDMASFVHSLVGEWPHPACPEVFAEGLGGNPRQVKRTVNVFLLLWRLAKAREVKLRGIIKPVRLAKVVAIQNIYPELYEVVKETPRLLRELEEYYRADLDPNLTPRPPSLQGKGETGEAGEEGGTRPELPLALEGNGEMGEAEEEGGKRPELPPALAQYAGRAAVCRLLTLHPLEMPDANFNGLPPDELSLYFTLTRRTEAPQVAPAAVAPKSFLEPQTVRVPAGRFLMGTLEEQSKLAAADGMNQEHIGWQLPQHRVELSEYAIGRYPVTNTEYQSFVQDANYPPPRGWDGLSYPEGKGDHPVVSVSWEDAMKYCRWLCEKTGKTYRLPTEAEWEKAARGADGRLYPWGNEWDPKKLNSAEAGPGSTTRVGQYSPGGDSPHGCADMAGDVWEWCADWFAGDEYRKRSKTTTKDPEGPSSGSRRVLRGGSFGDDQHPWLWCAARNHFNPSNRRDHAGFRVCWTTSPVSL